MRTLTRYAAGGIVVGFLATALVLLVLPHFYSHLYEMAAFPVACIAVGVLAGTAALAIKAVRGASGNSGHPILGGRFFVTLALSVLLCGALYTVRAPARSWKVAPKLVVLCIDGGTSQIIDPLVDAGQLPNLARLKNEGTSSVLMSTDPSFSLVVWTTIGAGVHPEKHGIKSFYHTQDYLQSKRIWEVFEDFGYSVGLFRWWITWPPRVKNGFVIPDILARDATCYPEKYTFVNQLRRDMKSGHPMSASQKLAMAWRFLRAGLRLETCKDIALEMLPAIRTGRFADKHIATRRAEIRIDADVYCHLLREIKPEYTCFYDNGADVFSHLYWKYYEPEFFGGVDPDGIERYGNVIHDYYALHDKVIGRILGHVDPTATVAVLSDHGFAADTVHAGNMYFPKGVSVLSDLKMDEEYYSVALASKTFIESVRSNPAEKSAALDRAVETFNSLVVQETGTRLFDARLTDEGNIMLVVSLSLSSLEGHVETPNGVVPLEDWFDTHALSGNHHPEGICIVKGQAYRKGHAGAQAQLVDIAPTLLYTAGFPLSKELDGSVKWDWIVDGFQEEHEVVDVDSYGHYDPVKRDVEVDEETLKKLRALGYVR